MLTQPNLRRVHLTKVQGGQMRRERDVLAVEEPLEIRLAFERDGQSVVRSISVTMRTPGEDFELAAGFLFNESVLRSRDDVQEIRYCVEETENVRQQYNIVTVQLRAGVLFDEARLRRNFYTTSSCGVCGKDSLDALLVEGCSVLPMGLRVSSQTISSLDAQLRKAQALFAKTGGLHAAALFNAGGHLISLHEDVGRHNALDKLIGTQFLASKTPLSQHILMVSGRVSFELMQKALMAQIPIIVAVGAPSSLAVELAQQFNITLIGFARGESFNIYSGAERVTS
jgi:FdhD protein